MIDPSMHVSIDRTSLGLDPLELVAQEGGSSLKVVGYTEPPRRRRITYAPDSAWVPGSKALGATYDQSLLSFDVVTEVANEAESRALLRELEAAVGQFAVAVTVTISDAPAETWACDPGSLTNSGREYRDFRYVNPVWALTLPCQPIPTIEES